VSRAEVERHGRHARSLAPALRAGHLLRKRAQRVVLTRLDARLRPPTAGPTDRRREAALVGAVGQDVLNEVNHLLCARRVGLSFNTSESTERPYFSTYPAVLFDVSSESTEVNL
jgi:hypothetical protein